MFDAAKSWLPSGCYPWSDVPGEANGSSQ